MSTSATPAEEHSDTTPEVAVVPEVAAAAAVDRILELAGPRLSPLGKRIELLRVDRGLSKQYLARSAGTSRQQLWRVMTGKSELTGTLCQRLATVLDVDSRTLSSAMLPDAPPPNGTIAASDPSIVPETLAAWLGSSVYLARALRFLPAGDEGVALKVALLNAIEERARGARLSIPSWLLRIRGSVLDGSL